jgi:hypothetical protein
LRKAIGDPAGSQHTVIEPLGRIRKDQLVNAEKGLMSIAMWNENVSVPRGDKFVSILATGSFLVMMPPQCPEQYDIYYRTMIARLDVAIFVLAILILIVGKPRHPIGNEGDNYLYAWRLSGCSEAAQSNDRN